MQVRVLGPLELVDEGGPVGAGGPKERRLLALLGAYANQVVAEERICEALWGDDAPRTAQATLRTHISRLRKILGEGLAIETAGAGYRLATGPGAIDVAQVEAFAEEARAAAGHGDWGRASEAATAALGHFRGPVLPELADTALGVAPSARLEELQASLAEARVEAELALGHHSGLVAELEGLCATYPLREGLWAARMVALYRSGRPAEALRAYQDLRHHLGEELGLEPSAELVRLESQVLAQDPALGWSAPTIPVETLPSGVVSFLLTDIEGSTRLWDTDASSMAEALERHDALAASVVAVHGGTLLKAKGEGDATVSVFRRASDAAGAALDLQRALSAEMWAGGLCLRVRMAIHTGEAHERGGDYFGPTLNRAARLRSLAAGGQVLCSQATAEVIHDRLPAGAQVSDLGQQVLRGVTRPEQVFALWAPDLGPAPVPLASSPPEAQPFFPALPASLVVDPGAPFVGREAELARLHGLCGEAAGGARRAVFIGGEPGVGKTRLVAEAAGRAREGGAIVLYGRCDEDLGVPFHPFVEALGAYVGACPPKVLGAQGGPRVGELARLLPEIASRLGGLAPPTRAEPETERYVLFEAVADLVVAIAAASPLVLVLDDLHWATKPTLLLLRHLLKRTESRLIVLATYRDTELDRAHPFAEALGDLRREPGAERVSLRGLDASGVYAYLQAAAGQADLDPRAHELAGALWAETEGNPFFVGEVLAHLVETGAVYEHDGTWTTKPGVAVADLGLPEGVREVITRRLSRLPPEANKALTVASVVGPSFSARLLEEVADLDPDPLLDALEQATGAGLIAEPRPGTYTFAHALIRQTLYSELSGTRRMRLHRKVGEALEAEPQPDRHLDALAHHFCEAALDGVADKAADYALAAGQQALASLAHEEAVTIFERGLAVLELQEPVDRERRCELLLALSEVQTRRNAVPELKATALSAVEDARVMGSATHLARAALAYSWTEVGVPEPAIVVLAQEALVALADEHPGLRARLLAVWASYLAACEGDMETADRLSIEALALTADRADWRAQWDALGARITLLRGTSRLDERLRLIAEQFRLAEEVDDNWFRYSAFEQRSAEQLVMGNIAAYRRDVEKGGAGSDLWSGWERPMELLLAGRFGDAVDVLSAPLGESSNYFNAYAAQLFQLHRELGTLVELEPLLRLAVAETPGILAFRSALALVLAETGQPAEAHREFSDLAEEDFGRFPRDVQWPVSLAMLAETAGLLGDGGQAGALYDLLRPWVGQAVVAQMHVVVFGAADRYLGKLAATLGRYDDAEAHYLEALRVEEGLESPPHLARTRLAYASLLATRGGPGDLELSAALARESWAMATELGMAGVAREARPLALPLPASLVVDPGAPFVGREAELARLHGLCGEAAGGSRRAVFIGGEPGVGKTRLVAEAAGRAREGGAIVLYGRCDEDLGVPFQPFVEALGAYVGACPPKVLGAQGGPRVGELARLLPEIASRLGGLAPPTRAEPETERYVLFEAVADLVVAIAAASPLVLVLDDLHWATKPTLLLLRHLLKRTESRLIVLATYRDTELDRAHPLAEALGDLRREPGAERVSLRGLDASGVYAYLQAAAGQADLDPRAHELAGALWAETEGNPFFVGEVLAHLVETGAVYEHDGTWTTKPGVAVADLGLPEGVREVITRRLSRLPPEANKALTVASVVGPSFSARLLEEVADLDPDPLLDALEQATGAGLIAEPRPGTYTFAHALIRQTLYSELSGTRRMRLHRKVGEALEAEPQPDRHLDALAHHFCEAALDGVADKAADYALAAGQQALTRLAHEQAAALLEAGLDAVGLADTPHPSLSCQLLLALIETRAWLGASVEAQKSLAFDAARLARQADDGTLLARAAVRATVGAVGHSDPAVLSLLAEAQAALPATEPALASMLLSSEAHYRAYSQAAGWDVRGLAERALELARDSGSTHALGQALQALSATLWGSSYVELRITLIDELIALGQDTANTSWIMEVGNRGIARLERGDRAGFESDAAEANALARESHNWYADNPAGQVLTALLDGRFDDAQHLADAYLELSATNPNLRDGLNIYAGWLIALRHEQGRSTELVDLVASAVTDNPDIMAFRAALALCYVDTGDHDGARRELDAAAVDNFAAVPHDQTYPVTMAIFCEVCASLGDRIAAVMLTDLFGADSGLLTMVTGADVSFGAVDRYLGMLSATLCDYERADVYFRAAVELEARVESPPFLARTKLWYARMLLARDRPEDRARAVTMLGEAVATADELGMAGVAAGARALLQAGSP